MTAYRSRAVLALRIHCPIADATYRALTAGDASAIERDPVAARLLAIVRDDSPLGDFGLYRAVVELAPGWEIFRPGADAQPTLGSADADTASPTAILTLYIPEDAPVERRDAAIAAILAAHPWEIPVVELTPTRLLLRA